MRFHCQGPSRQIIAGLQRAGVEASLHARSHVQPSCAPNPEMEFSLCANGGSSCSRQEEGNLVGLCQILNPFLLTPFSDCTVAELLAGGGMVGVRSDSSLSVLHMNRCDHNITIV